MLWEEVKSAIVDIQEYAYWESEIVEGKESMLHIIE